MFDEHTRLMDSPLLMALLSHYAQVGVKTRESWQDRLMSLEGATSRELSRLHGELIAYGWLEQNTGLTPMLQPEAAPACYRITREGMRTFKTLRSSEDGSRPSLESHCEAEA